MGQGHASGEYFHSAAVKEHFASIQTLWSDEELQALLTRLTEMTLNFSLDRVKFARLLQLPVAYENLVSQWFEDFSRDRASQVADGLEFLSASIMISSNVTLFRKICLLFALFDLDRTGCIRKDEFTIFLKAVTTGLHRMVAGLPPPGTVLELGVISAEFFANLGDQQVLSQQDLLTWTTEAHYSLHYVSVLSRVGFPAVFAFGSNLRCQLGLHMEPKMQSLPAPLLGLEGKRVLNVASGESHCLFLTDEGAVWSCGHGFCGILGHREMADTPQPRIIEALSHTRIVDVAVGVRHSAAISENGRVFTWGSADLGQLGHGNIEDKEVHQWAYDPKTGGSFAYVTVPTVVMSLFGKKVVAKKVSCCNFSTIVLTNQGSLYSWGNNTDGQCGQGMRCPEHKLVYVEQHMHRTAMQVLFLPRLVETRVAFTQLVCGGYHALAVDADQRLWTWGQGLWGKLGHGDQRSMYDPRLVEALKHHICTSVAAGESHSLCLCSLYRLTITGSSTTTPMSPFSLLGLPLGSASRQDARRQLTTPPNTSLELDAFASARLVQVGLPLKHEPDQPIVDPAQYSPASIANSVVLIDRSLWEGEWLKLSTSDFDWFVSMSRAGQSLPSTGGITAPLLCSPQWETNDGDLRGKICVFEVSPRLLGTPGGPAPTKAMIIEAVLLLALECATGGGAACICILPKDVDIFPVNELLDPRFDRLRAFSFGVMSFKHGEELKSHTQKLVDMRVAQAPGGVVEERVGWEERREDFTGRPFWEHPGLGRRRWAAPIVDSGAQAQLLLVNEDGFLDRLKGVAEMKPRGIILCQQSWRPDVELVTLPESEFGPELFEVPMCMVAYEAGEELKTVATSGADPVATMEIQPTGGVYTWGNGTFGQLGLKGIENQPLLQNMTNTLTFEDNDMVDRPSYLAHLHEHEVVDVAAGSGHTSAVTQKGEVFTWGARDGLGVHIDAAQSDVPIFVDQLDGLVCANRVFAGHNHTFVVADMPFPSIV